MTPDEAAGHVRAWLAQPVVQVLEPHADHIEHVLPCWSRWAPPGIS
ncbi:MAG TPA: hypothetical protein VNJ03_16135 [Vicinamibacterales bacterium]|nr:hypothetical protein [Vicinamibacterales bacterium]